MQLDKVIADVRFHILVGYPLTHELKSPKLPKRSWVKISQIRTLSVERIGAKLGRSTPEELAQLRAWFLEFDWALWDRQLERDVAAGKLDVLAEKALRDHVAGKTTPL